MRVRAAALARMGADPTGSVALETSNGRLLQLFPLVYLWHRYEMAATSKLLGGLMVQFTLRSDEGDEDEKKEMNRNPCVPAAMQRAALQELMAALDPAALAIPAALVARLRANPEAFGYTRGSDLGGVRDLLGSRMVGQRLTCFFTGDYLTVVFSSLFRPVFSRFFLLVSNRLVSSRIYIFSSSLVTF
jgi:hypothetical protein